VPANSFQLLAAYTPCVVHRKLEDLPTEGAVYVMPLTDHVRAVARVLCRRPSPLPASMHGRYGSTDAIVALCDPFITEPDEDVDISTAAKLMTGVHERWRGEIAIMKIVGFPPPDFVLLGRRAPTRAERKLDRDDLGAWVSFAEAALEEWQARTNPKHTKAKQVRTLRQLGAIDVVAVAKAASAPLTQIDSKPLASKASRILRRAANRLTGLRGKGADDRWSVIKACIEGFNELDAHHEFIDTTVREELCERVALLGEAAGLRDIDDAIAEWRDW
jgi:hypothetical protein